MADVQGEKEKGNNGKMVVNPYMQGENRKRESLEAKATANEKPVKVENPENIDLTISMAVMENMSKDFPDDNNSWNDIKKVKERIQVLEKQLVQA